VISTGLIIAAFGTQAVVPDRRPIELIQQRSGAAAKAFGAFPPVAFPEAGRAVCG
jgi:hypothetical protein